ncbi:Alkaline phosphatase synthesis sensor protein PhoR [Roseivivax jejudonensis]|uniref:histidine kinase n=1 Tax=Roseivivax jejudonensis TaxID=1529041 RepID=A0A1X6YPG4_9RHOB|nr:ATP-binding protein [Roseivivax jejudonensis]SLN26857.1 Alkaline phosphatase synthesis sensor protein PhoR [Roseivivax jejudonensis]
MVAGPGSIVAAIPMPALLIARDERIIAANAEAVALLGATIEGRHFITVLRQPQTLEAVEGALRTGAPSQAVYLSNDGRQDTSFRVTARQVDEGGTTGVIVCFEDETHRAQAEQMRRDFVANVSHELKTPLTALIGFIDTLRGPAREDPNARDRFLGIMESEANRMNRLVSDLLSLSRVEAEERVRPTARLDLAALIRATVRSLEPVAAEAGVTVALELSSGTTEIVGDTDQLRQVLVNLIENAIKYSGEGTTTRVALTGPSYEPRVRGQGVRIRVADSGPGIDPVHIPRLTERFYRIDTHRSRERGGTGLGLAIVKHIVNRHRGRLLVDSTPGEGSEFTVVLPTG